MRLPPYATLLVFAGSMFGLVLSDNLLALFMFWELTSITSFLLIGTEDTKGGELQKETYALLKKAGEDGYLNFIGNIESRDVLLGKQRIEKLTVTVCRR